MTAKSSSSWSLGPEPSELAKEEERGEFGGGGGGKHQLEKEKK